MLAKDGASINFICHRKGEKEGRNIKTLLKKGRNNSRETTVLQKQSVFSRNQILHPLGLEAFSPRPLNISFPSYDRRISDRITG